MPPDSPRRLCVIVALLVAAACGDGDDRAAAADPPFRGVSTVVGSDVEEWSLLAVPREGGRVEARAVGDPARVVWTGETRLPAAAEIHLLEGPALVLRTPSGEVHRYDPGSDELTRVGRVGEDAVWTASGSYGVFSDPGDGLLQVGPDGAWRYDIAGRPVWASAAGDGGVTVLVEREGEPLPALWLVRRGKSEPVARADSAFRPPALVTAWGRRVAALGSDGETLRFVAVPSLSPVGGVPLGGPVGALAASPSSHEIYAGVGGPPRILRVSRFAGESRVLAETDREVRAIRPAILGSFLLVDDGGDPLWIPLGGGSARRLGGEWRPDLPLGTPDGRVLLARGGGLAAWDPADGGTAEPVEAPAGRWWGGVRWNPSPPAVVSDRVDGERVAAGGPDTAGRRSAPPPPDSLVPGAAGAGGAGEGTDRLADTAPRAGPESPDSVPARRSLPAGFYAVVTSARDADGVRRLLERLSRAGYPTALERHRDDAGRIWFRGTVGPYESREEAEAAARQLRRERGVDPWVSEVRAGAGARDVFP